MRTKLFDIESCGRVWPIYANTETDYKVIQLYDIEVIKKEVKAKLDLALQGTSINMLDPDRLYFAIRCSLSNLLKHSNLIVCGKFVIQCRLYQPTENTMGFILEDYTRTAPKNSNLLISYRDIKMLYQNPDTVKTMVRKAMRGDYGLTEHKKYNVYEIFGPSVNEDTNSVSYEKMMELYFFFSKVYAEFGYNEITDNMVIDHSIAGYAYCQMRIHTHGRLDPMIFIYCFIVCLIRLENSGDDFSCLSDMEAMRKNHYQSRYIRNHKLLKRKEKKDA